METTVHNDDVVSDTALALPEEAKLAIIARRKKLLRKKKQIQALVAHHMPQFDLGAKARHLGHRNRNTVVLFEKDYHGLMREIIERDYFPDLERMRKSMDILKLREQGFNDQADAAEWQLQNILERARRRELDRGISISSHVDRKDEKGWRIVEKIRSMQKKLHAGGEFTPAIRGIEDGGEARPLLPLDDQRESSVYIDLPNDTTVNVNVDALSLDQFHRKFQSEDNASFNELTIKKEEETMRKHAWMVEAAEKQNLKTLQLRMSRDKEIAFQKVVPLKSLESENVKALNSILYDDMEKGRGDEAQRKAHRELVGSDKAPGEVLAVVPSGLHTKEHRIVVSDALEAPDRGHALMTARAEPKNALFFTPSTRKQVYTEPKGISTASTRLKMQHQRDDVLQMGALTEQEVVRRAKSEYDRLSTDVKEKVDEWLLKGGPIPHGVEFIQRGMSGSILSDKITAQMIDSELGYEFQPENQRDIVGRSLADEVLEKRRKERFNSTEIGRKEKGEFLKNVLRTPASYIASVGVAPYGESILGSTRGLLSTHGRSYLATGGGTTGGGTTGLGGKASRRPGGRIAGGNSEMLSPFLKSSELIRGYVQKASQGPLSTTRAYDKQHRPEEDSTNLVD